MKNILILEDLKDAQRWLADAARRAWPDAEVQFYSTLRSACQALDERAPQLCLVDLQLPDGSGVDFIRQCRQQHPDAQLVVATMYDDDMHLFPALQAGANGYLLKELRATALVDAIRRVAAGESLLEPGVTERVTARLTQSVDGPSPLDALTPREKDVLGLIAEGLSNREIGARLFLAEKTVKNNVSAIFAKLGMQRRTQAAVLAAEWLPRERPAP